VHSLTENYPDNKFSTSEMALTSARGVFSVSKQLTDSGETCWSR